MRCRSIITLIPIFLAASTPMAGFGIRVPSAPEYDLNLWNNNPSIKNNNNCYAFAANDIDTEQYGAFPGERTKGYSRDLAPKIYKSFVAYIIDGAQSDGMIFTGKIKIERLGYYHVALYTHAAVREQTRHSYHWITENPDGTFSGKNGQTKATNLDFAGNIIIDPAKANFGLYQFRGYFLVPKHGLDVGSPHEPITKPGSRPAFLLS